MVAYAGELERRDSISRSLVASVGMHAGICVILAGFTWWIGKHDLLGNENSGPGAATIETVDKIPTFNRPTRLNPVANDTQSEVPQQTKPETKIEKQDEPDAIDLGDKKKPKKKKKEKAKELITKLTKERIYTPSNQLSSSIGARMYTPMFTQVQGGGGVGLGSTNPFGTRLGAYADLIRQRIAEKWRTQDLDPSLNNLDLTVSFDILRSGEVRSIRVFKKSGNYTMDNSAIRALTEASPLPPLPAEFERNVANVEFQFKLQR